jgi:hypothetical protein
METSRKMVLAVDWLPMGDRDKQLSLRVAQEIPHPHNHRMPS